MKLLRALLIGGIVLVVLLELYVLLQKGAAPPLEISRYYTQGIITIESIDHQERNTGGDKPLTKYEGDAFGLAWHNNFSVLESYQPASRGRGIASGDYNNDGWEDILLGTYNGILLYKNLGGRFALQDINLADIPNLDLGVHVAAFVDIDNDGWQDIYITIFGGKNYFILNDTKDFKSPRVLEVPNTGTMLTTAVSFGDLDKDGDLDFLNGNWQSISRRSGADNKLIINKNLEFTEKDLKEFRGQTLSVLFSDFNNNNVIDLITGNEFDKPDNFYIGDGEGGLREIKKSDGMVPVSAVFNMGIDVADFNNDLYMDIYVSGVSTYDTFTENPCPDIQNNKERQKCEKNYQIINIVRERSMEKCAVLAGKGDGNECMAMVMLSLSARQDDSNSCGQLPENYKLQKLMCFLLLAVSANAPDPTREGFKEAIVQVTWQNVLLEGSESGVFKETSRENNVHHAFNSWNAKFADLDNDEWQDIYVVTGELTARGSVFQPNVFFHNFGGQFFKPEQEEFGLEDVGIVPSYIYTDMDNDGDLDVITVPINGPLHVYVNNENQRHSITFEFRDGRGNYFGIGNKIYIYYGASNERHQVREIKLGGGFLSFDAPVVHFGLGEYDTVNKIEIAWSTGERTTINKDFLTGKKYVITRER